MQDHYSSLSHGPADAASLVTVPEPLCLRAGSTGSIWACRSSLQEVVLIWPQDRFTPDHHILASQVVQGLNPCMCVCRIDLGIQHDPSTARALMIALMFHQVRMSAHVCAGHWSSLGFSEQLRVGPLQANRRAATRAWR